MSPEYIDTVEPLTSEDPSLVWMRREHPERLSARETPHAFVHDPRRDPRNTCPPEGNAGCICETCWERKSFRIHKAAR